MPDAKNSLKPAPTKAEQKIDATDRAARELIREERAREDAKILRLRLARLDRDKDAASRETPQKLRKKR